MLDVNLLIGWLNSQFPDGPGFVTGLEDPNGECCIVQQRPGLGVVLEGLFHQPVFTLTFYGRQFDGAGPADIATLIHQALVGVDCPHTLWGTRCIEVSSAGDVPAPELIPDTAGRTPLSSTYRTLMEV